MKWKKNLDGHKFPKLAKKKKEKDIENYIFDLQTNLNSQFTFSPKGDSCPRQLH